MKVLVLAGGFLEVTGGIETYTRSLIGALLQMDEVKRLEILALNDGRGLDHSELDKRVRYKGFGRNKVAFAAKAIGSARSADVVIAIHINLATLFPAMKLLGSGRRILIVHGIEVWQRLSSSRLRGAIAANTILAVSDFTRGKLVSFNPELSAKNFEILSGTFDPNYAKQTHAFSREELGLPSGKMILVVTRLKETELYKNVDMVVRGMPSVLARQPDAFLVIVGEGKDRLRLEEIVRDRGVGDQVLFTGRVSAEKLPSYYKNCDVFVLPSTKEGLGIVYLEAMHHAKPCIGVTAGAAKEVISHEETGLLTNADDPPQLPEAINRLFDNPTLAQRMGAAGRERLEAMFSPKCFGHKVRELLLRSAPQ